MICRKSCGLPWYSSANIYLTINADKYITKKYEETFHLCARTLP